MNDTEPDKKGFVLCVTLTVSDVSDDTLVCQQVQSMTWERSMEEYEKIWTSFEFDQKQKPEGGHGVGGDLNNC